VKLAREARPVPEALAKPGLRGVTVLVVLGVVDLAVRGAMEAMQVPVLAELAGHRTRLLSTDLSQPRSTRPRLNMGAAGQKEQVVNRSRWVSVLLRTV
jgi:hypothetical protein